VLVLVFLFFLPWTRALVLVYVCFVCVCVCVLCVCALCVCDCLRVLVYACVLCMCECNRKRHLVLTAVVVCSLYAGLPELGLLPLVVMVNCCVARVPKCLGLHAACTAERPWSGGRAAGPVVSSGVCVCVFVRMCVLCMFMCVCVCVYARKLVHARVCIPRMRTDK